MKNFFLSLTVLFFCPGIRAQTNIGNISGIIKDSNGKPLDGVDIVLKLEKDSSVVKHSFSGLDGNFHFDGIRDGRYFIYVQLMGFSKAASPVVDITKGIASVRSVDLTLSPVVKMLKGVDVVSRKPLIENKIDKTVVNVDAYITNSGNTALDLLSASPNVAVDQSTGTISIKGKSGSVILI